MFLLANISIEVVQSMLFLNLNNVDNQFAKKKLAWRTYTFGNTLLTTKHIELMNKKKFARTTLNKKSKTFVLYIAILEDSLVGIIIHPLQKV